MVDSYGLQNQKDAWTYPTQQQGHHPSSVATNNNPYYYYPQQQQPHYDTSNNNNNKRSNNNRPSSRPRTPSNNTTSVNSSKHHPHVVPIQLQKSSSTPIPSSNNYNRSSMLLKQQQQQHYAQGRREKQKKQQLQQKQQKQQTTTHTHSYIQPAPSQERPPSLSSTASSVPSPAPSLEDSGRRSSVTSVSSGTFSIRSEMSMNTKLSLSKRLRKVFSMSHLRSKDNMSLYSVNSGSNTSLATVQETEGSGGPYPSPSPSTPPSRRRSFASLSGLFQKHGSSTASLQQQQQQVAPSPRNMSPSNSGDLRKMAKNQRGGADRSSRPVLRVDTTPEEATKRNIKGRSPSSAAPDSPSSARSTTRPAVVPRFMGNTSDALPSPTPSSSSTSSNRLPLHEDPSTTDMVPPPSIGLHYGLPLHGSPRLRPTNTGASSSTSSLNTMTNTSTSTPRSRLQFCPTIQVHETFTAAEYDRRCDSNATCQKLTPLLAMKIKQELNEFKLTDMEVHVDSRQYTHFFL
ncbi:hypothetical protein BDA99DRAFT_497769 [Phascolomyces articulosus]|uniref:Uncharacterized protein n=1 Tax=Phascolomyces articulosus TaxID=60185 RepID=A0AAD5K8G8_9FUNG|nr:hypothetical protein BDA99DRAFT_497769 [Phascolomyces articulosus]